MKYLLFLFIFIAFAIFIDLKAQTPQPIYGFARVEKPLAWYKEQATAWKKEVEKNSKNANAWYNYYRVKRNLLSCDSTDKRPRPERVKELKTIVEQMAVEVPDSYEYNYCKFSFEGNNFEYLSYLKRADELSNGRTLHFDYMINWGEVERNMERRDKYCRKWFEAGEVSTGFLYYNYNVIIGMQPNAIVFTAGDNDTYPIWVLQSQGIRRDITVLNIYLLHLDDYRTKVFKELGVEKWEMKQDSNGNYSDEDIKRFKEGIIKHVAANKKGSPVYVGVSVNDDYTKSIEENLYLTGLTYMYSRESVDNMAIMKRNFEQLYSLDYIDKPFYRDVSVDRVNFCSSNYIVPMLKLYDHYKVSGDTQKMEWIKKKLLFIAKGKEEEKDVIEHLEQK